MQTLLRPHGVMKNLKYIFSDKMADKYNVDGVFGKKSLKEYEFFYKALLGKFINVCNYLKIKSTITYINCLINLSDCIPFSETGTPDEQIRKAMQLQKKRIFKKNVK